MDRSKIKSKSQRFKTKKSKALTLQHKWQALSFGAKLFILSPIAIVLCYRILDSTICVRYFSLIYGSLGIVLYVILKFSFRENKLLKFDFWGYPGSFLIFVSLCALLNYVTLKPAVKIKTVIIDKKGQTSLKANSRACYVFFNEDGKPQRFTIDRELWNSIYEGEKIKMHFQESLFGFNIIKEFAK